MSDYNKKGVMYNKRGVGSGATYNSEKYIRVIPASKSTETAKVMETVSQTVSISILENLKLNEEIKQFVTLLQSDSFGIRTSESLFALLEITDRSRLQDLKPELTAHLTMNDDFRMEDLDARVAISDFLIGVMDDLDNAYDWLLPFKLRVDWGKTEIPVMPEAELTTIEIPGVDGSIIADSVYKDRIFKIVSYSQDNLTRYEKEELKTKIAQILDRTKNQAKKLTVLVRDTSFDVRYEGGAEIFTGPSFVRATVPFHTTPYGREMFDNILKGSGLISNDGDTATGPVHTIHGPIQNPSFMLGDVSYSWTGSIPDGGSLVIDHQRKTCFIVNGLNKTNGLARLKGNFQLIPAGVSVSLVADSKTESKIWTLWYNRVIW